MQQLYFVKKEKLQWREVNIPRLVDPNEAIVRPFAVAKCDLDDAFLFNNLNLKMKIGRFLGLIDPYYSKIFGNLLKEPFPFGHECVAEVTEVGEGVKNINVGDVVTVPFQISCGMCNTCKSGITSACEKVAPVSTYGFGKHLEFGGAMSDFIKVPFADGMLLKIPGHIDPIHLASLSDNIPDAYRHISDVGKNKDQNILIISGKAKSVALYTVILAKALGAKEVDYVDNDPDRLVIAKKSGADNIFESFSQVTKKYDMVIDAGSTAKSLDMAFKAVRNFGTVSSSGIYIRKTPVSLIRMYGKGINFKMGMANARADAGKIIEILKEKELNFDLVTSRLDSWDNAIEAFLTQTAKVIVTRDRVF